MRRLGRKLLVPAFGVVLGTSGFAFLATNTVPASNAGVGANVVSGYNISNVHYALVTNPDTPGGTYIQQVSFQMSPDNATTSNVLAWFEDSSGNFVSGYYACAETSGTWDCQNPNVINDHQWSSTQDAKELHVSAAQ